ncbi:hypothetical protein BaRGS_00007116 [Batillaria attramentaria]|uniref:Uncharacterized protein n=1 Tax=Batillaria attramentaria TaxID=370345 RepID=A0ABD0LQB6_9CAEN
MSYFDTFTDLITATELTGNLTSQGLYASHFALTASSPPSRTSDFLQTVPEYHKDSTLHYCTESRHTALHRLPSSKRLFPHVSLCPRLCCQAGL